MNYAEPHLPPSDAQIRRLRVRIPCRWRTRCARSMAADAAGALPEPAAPEAPHFAAKAKRVIFLFMQGAPSHVDTFDYKPQLARMMARAGHAAATCSRSPWKFKQYGKSGLYVSASCFPTSAQHADDLCVLNGMYTDNPAHPQATIQLHTGSAICAALDGLVGALRPGHGEPESARASSPSIRRRRSAGRRTTAAGFFPPPLKGRGIDGAAARRD